MVPRLGENPEIMQNFKYYSTNGESKHSRKYQQKSLNYLMFFG
jgi:hypothetical protein